MGLDQYLYRKVYLGAKYEHNNVKGTIEITKGKNNTLVNISLDRISEISEEVAYWRKANQIHQWFVQNVQDGNDDCGSYDVTKEELQQLVDLCKTVLKTAKTVDGQVWNGTTWTQAEGKIHNYEAGKVIVNQDEIEALLPTTSGFFFGNTDYDEYYLRDLQNTVDQIEPLLLVEDNDDDYEYSSSW
jgi:homoserine trans-succinylase